VAQVSAAEQHVAQSAVMIGTSKNRGPASLLGSDSGDANALYSAPKHLIDPTFCTNMPTSRFIEMQFK